MKTNSLLKHAVFCSSLLIAAASQADTLANMERERASLISTLLSPDYSLEERQARVDRSYRRLTDLERIVVRDDQVHESNSPTARQAFANYDLSFLVHASAEADTSAINHWLNELGISSDTILEARAGRR